MSRRAISALTPGLPQGGSIFNRATVTGAENFSLPVLAKGRKLMCHAEGVDVWTSIGTATQAPSITSVSGVATAGNNFLIAAATNGSLHIPAGATEPFDLSTLNIDQTDSTTLIYVGHVSKSTAGFFRLWVVDA